MAFVTSPVSLLFFICFVCVIRDSVQLPTNAVNQVTTTTELANTTAANTTTAVDTHDSLVPNTVGSIAKNNNYTNYSLKDQKLLVNNSLNLDTSQLPRSIANSASQSSAGFSITLVAVLLVVITLIVSIILTAVFVMRRRFSIWRVNGDRLTGSGAGDDGAKGALTKSTSSENASTAGETVKVESETAVKETTAALTTNESQKSIECEKKLDDEQVKEVVASCIAELNCVENPQAQLVCVTEPVKAAETSVETVEPKTEEVKADVETNATVEQQPSPATSETRLIETTVNEEESKVKETPVQSLAAKSASTVSLSSSAVNPVSPIPSSNDLNPSAAEPAPATTNTVSSTSLITNVISDIADSVASKLAAKSASKSALNDNNDEKQPLNNE